MRDQEMEKYSVYKWLCELGLGQTEIRNQELHLISYESSSSWSTCAFFHSFPRCNKKKLDMKQSNWDSKVLSHCCWHCKRWLNCHNISWRFLHPKLECCLMYKSVEDLYLKFGIYWGLYKMFFLLFPWLAYYQGMYTTREIWICIFNVLPMNYILHNYITHSMCNNLPSLSFYCIWNKEQTTTL